MNEKTRPETMKWGVLAQCVIGRGSSSTAVPLSHEAFYSLFAADYSEHALPEIWLRWTHAGQDGK